MTTRRIHVGSDSGSNQVAIQLDDRVAFLSMERTVTLVDMLITHMQIAGCHADLDAIRSHPALLLRT